jgi:hypothetical protein
VISQEGGSGPNIAQTGERSIAQTGAQSSVQVQQGAPAAVEAQEPRAMQTARVIAFLMGVIIAVLTAASVISVPVGVPIAALLMGGAAGAARLLQVVSGGESAHKG